MPIYCEKCGIDTKEGSNPDYPYVHGWSICDKCIDFCDYLGSVDGIKDPIDRWHWSPNKLIKIRTIKRRKMPRWFKFIFYASLSVLVVKFVSNIEIIVGVLWTLIK